LYNPDNLELPSYDAPSLTDYKYSYDTFWAHALAFDGEGTANEIPWVETDFWTPFKVRIPVHFMMWPETETERMALKTFEVGNLDPNHPSFDLVKSEVSKFLGWPIDDSIDDWYQDLTESGCDKLALVKYRVRYEWTVRAWQGLTLEHLKSLLDTTDDALEFTVDHSIDWDGSVLLDSWEVEGDRRPNSLILEKDITSFPAPNSLNRDPKGFISKQRWWTKLINRLRF
jgi:hypothetical protein